MVVYVQINGVFQKRFARVCFLSGISLLRHYRALMLQTGVSSVPARRMSGLPEQPECTGRYSQQIKGKMCINWRQEGANSPL